MTAADKRPAVSGKPDVWAELRKPFPKEAVGTLPKAGVKLDYVGHAAVTDRLLTVDPNWTWEPLALDAEGLPALDEDRNLWIKLTVAGVTRIGVGDGRNMKERIGDALRNAAMRFGVALDLWTKDELESTLAQPELKNIKPSQAPKSKFATTEQKAQVAELLRQNGVPIVDMKRELKNTYGVENPNSMTVAEAETIIKMLGANRMSVAVTFDNDDFPDVTDPREPYIREPLAVRDPGPRKCAIQGRCQCGMCTDIFRDQLDEPEEAL